MSERYCTGCGRPLPWTWPEGPSLAQIGYAMRNGLPMPPSGAPSDAIQAPTCSQVPASYARGSIEHRGTCAEQWDRENELELRERETSGETPNDRADWLVRDWPR